MHEPLGYLVQFPIAQLGTFRLFPSDFISNNSFPIYRVGKQDYGSRDIHL